MCEATELIAQSLDTGARSIGNRIDGLAGTLRTAVNSARNVDADGAEVINRGRYSFDVSDSQGALLHVSDIRVNPLVDHEGNIFGISFPTAREGDPGVSFPDEEAYSAWSRQPNRLGDTEFYPEQRVTPVDGGEPYWAEAGPGQPAPWADDAQDGMLYVQAHADSRGFRIDANLGTDDNPDWQNMILSGNAFGKLVAANKDFQAASRAGAGKPLLMLACRAGDPVYAHAEQAAGVIHRAGMNHDVYATVGVNVARWSETRGTAEVGVEVPNGTTPSDVIVVIRAPNSPTGP
ncbi:hypothetical protein [Nocardia sp. alder85J]|uniref:hypothetical protein n=1 Tax=Nocardia sp. alder85J TaxID=2862949 RepID=UPI001CD6C66E|nr:hypothetical protein [Nocardia sp. alder85J]MCX4091753.1 hypothetical protein [Nocardia sp. alder85J]